MTNKLVIHQVKKAIENGAQKDISKLSNLLGRDYTSIRQALQTLYPDEKFEAIDFEEIQKPSQCTLEELIIYAAPIYEKYGAAGIVNYKVYNHPCACMGPQDDQPLCPCQMQMFLYLNRTEVLDRLSGINEYELNVYV